MQEVAVKEIDAVAVGTLKVRTEKEREILRIFKKAAATAEGDPEPDQQPKEPKSEFLLSCLKLVPAIYREMDISELMNIQTVEPKICEDIALNKFVELKDIVSGDEPVIQHKLQTQESEDGKSSYITFATTPKHQDPKTQPQFFHALYSWGQFYLQCFPEKATAFLEYLLFISKYGVIYNVPTLISLDQKIRKFYVQNPDLQWDMAGKMLPCLSIKLTWNSS